MEGSSFSLAPEPEGAEDHLSPLMVCNTPLLGADWSAGRWQAGVALCPYPPGGAAPMTETDNGADGEISSTLTGVFPRVRPHHQKRTMVARRMAERKTWAHGRSGLQWAASPSLGKRAS